METKTPSRDMVFKVTVLGLLIAILLYQINLDRKLTNLHRSVQRASSSAEDAATKAEKLQLDIQQIADRLGV